MLHPRVLRDTVLQGVERGLLVARLARPDGTHRTWWHETVDTEAENDSLLEVVLPERAELADLPEHMLAPGALPSLWADGTLPMRKLFDYFSGEHTVSIEQLGYEDYLSIPCCSADAVSVATERAVRAGTVWVVNGPASCWREATPFGVIDTNAHLHPPPMPIPAQELVAEALPPAWRDGETNGATLVQALSAARGEPVPWGLVRESIKDAVASRWLEFTDMDAASRDEIGEVTAHFATAANVRLRLPKVRPKPDSETTTMSVDLDPPQLQDLADQVPALLEATAGHGLRFHVRVSLETDAPDSVRGTVDSLLHEVTPKLRSDLRRNDADSQSSDDT